MSSANNNQIGDLTWIYGRAQSPSMRPWAINENGAIRTINEAMEIARNAGVIIPEDIKFRTLQEWKVPPIKKAEYFVEYTKNRPKFVNGKLETWDDYFEWDEMYTQLEDLPDKIPVRIHPGILNSDVAFLAIFSHEMHELNNLRRIFNENGGEMTYRAFSKHVSPGFPGNLHDQAWDVADFLVRKMREGVDVQK